MAVVVAPCLRASTRPASPQCSESECLTAPGESYPAPLHILARPLPRHRRHHNHQHWYDHHHQNCPSGLIAKGQPIQTIRITCKKLSYQTPLFAWGQRIRIRSQIFTIIVISDRPLCKRPDHLDDPDYLQKSVIPDHTLQRASPSP